MVDLTFWDSEHVAPTYADPFLKYISVEADVESGNVEATTGWFTIMDITREDIARWVRRDGDPWISERRNFSPGWYGIVLDNNGIVFGFFYGIGDTAEAAARRDFAKAEKAFRRWEGSLTLNEGEKATILNNLRELRAEAQCLIEEIKDSGDEVDITDDSLAWNAVGVIAGDLARVAAMLWTDGDSPIE